MVQWCVRGVRRCSATSHPLVGCYVADRKPADLIQVIFNPNEGLLLRRKVCTAPAAPTGTTESLSGRTAPHQSWSVAHRAPEPSKTNVRPDAPVVRYDRRPRNAVCCQPAPCCVGSAARNGTMLAAENGKESLVLISTRGAPLACRSTRRLDSCCDTASFDLVNCTPESACGRAPEAVHSPGSQ